ncbi:MAG: hypothetical protein MT490_10020 [Sphingomonas sp.]|uniref:hypothetical protein n=1 Tax=Sphingomonas sp. TaxID=28214 RepID=UPI002274EB65|nr:hypothetical protein [Sphingomonas sp.]MCX8476120.1 hypothetical protein [Sphingomonas sp.]
MLALLLLAADPETTAVDAENAFRRAAQAEGQWTAFRKFAAEDALLFTPQPEKAHSALPTENPPIAVQWWPAESYVSCDAATAVNTGPWVRPASVGYFTTVWEKQPGGGWKWVLDHGDTLTRPRALAEKPRVRSASCGGTIPEWAHAPCRIEAKCGHGLSADRTLHWDWQVEPDGSRRFTAELWNGRDYDTVVRDEVTPKQ